MGKDCLDIGSNTGQVSNVSLVLTYAGFSPSQKLRHAGGRGLDIVCDHINPFPSHIQERLVVNGTMLSYRRQRRTLLCPIDI